MNQPSTLTEHAGAQLDDDRAAIEDLLQAFVKSLRVVQLYPENNPIHRRTIDRLRTAFGPVWDICPELELQVTESTLEWEGTVVLSEESKSDSVAWTLFKDGVRTLTLAPGAEQEEVVALLEVIHEARRLSADTADDLLTLLWEQDFKQIRYTYLELGEDDAPPMTASKSEVTRLDPATLQHQVVEETEESAPSGVVRIEDFDSTLYFLDEEEINYLTTEINREYGEDLRRKALSTVFDLIEMPTYASVRSELIELVEQFIPYLLGVGDYGSVAYVLQEIRAVLERTETLHPGQRTALVELPATLSEPAAVDQLMQALADTTVYPAEQDLGELFGELRPQALARVLEWLPKVSNERVRDLLDRAAERLARAHPDELARVLQSTDRSTLLGATRLAARLRLPDFIKPLGRVLRNEDTAVRQTAVGALAELASAEAMQQLGRAIGDAERDVRIQAVQTLALHDYQPAVGRIQEAITGPTLNDADLTEKRAFFEAYATLAGQKGIAVLQPILVKGGLLRRKQNAETRACAAMALGKIGGPDAKSILTKLQREKDPVVRNAVNSTLREMS